MMIHKQCRKCGSAKPAAGFHRHAARPDGLQPDCKECRAKRVRTSSENGKRRLIPTSYERNRALELPTRNFLAG